METIRFDTSALRSRIMNQYGTIKAFADAVHMSPRTLGSRLNDHTEFNADEIQKISMEMNLSCSEVNQYFFTKQHKAHSLLQLAEMFLEMSADQQRMLLAIMDALIADPEGTRAKLSGQAC